MADNVTSPTECWGAHLTGRPCTPGFTSSGSHMHCKCCPACLEAGVQVPASRVRALRGSQHVEYPNSHGRSPWSGFGWRVVNHTKRCHGPRLIIFKGEPPLGVEWAPTPPEWIGVDAQGLIIVRLVSKNGTLCPEQKAPSRCSLPSPGHVPFALSNLPLLGVAPLAESVPDGFTSGKRHRDDSSSSGSVSGDGSTTNASYDGGHVVSSSAPLAYVGAAPVAPSLHIAPTSVASAVAPSANPIAIATAIDCSVAPSPLAVATSGLEPAPAAEPPSAHALWNAFGQLHRMVRARLAYDQSAARGRCTPGPPVQRPPTALASQALGHTQEAELLRPQPPLAPLLSAIETTAACLLGHSPSHRQGQPQGGGHPQALAPGTQQTRQPPLLNDAVQAAVEAGVVARMPAIPPGMAASPPVVQQQAAAEQAAAATFVAEPFDAFEREVASWLEMAPALPSPPTSPPDATPPPAAPTLSKPRAWAVEAATAVLSFLVFWWHELTPSSAELPTQATYGAHAAKDLAASATFAPAPHDHWLPAMLLRLCSQAAPVLQSAGLQSEASRRLLLPGLALGAVSSSIVACVANFAPEDSEPCAPIPISRPARAPLAPLLALPSHAPPPPMHARLPPPTQAHLRHVRLLHRHHGVGPAFRAFVRGRSLAGCPHTALRVLPAV